MQHSQIHLHACSETAIKEKALATFAVLKKRLLRVMVISFLFLCSMLSYIYVRFYLEICAALLLAVVVELALPVHHVGAPAMELHFPLPLNIINVVWARNRKKHIRRTTT